MLIQRILQIALVCGAIHPFVYGSTKPPTPPTNTPPMTLSAPRLMCRPEPTLGVGADGKRPTVETRRFRAATNFDIMKRVMFRPKQTQAYKLGVNGMFGAGNQYYHRHEEE